MNVTRSERIMEMGEIEVTAWKLTSYYIARLNDNHN